MRYVLLFRGDSQGVDQDLARLAEEPSIDLVDNRVPGLALIEAPEEAMPKLRRLLPGWLIEREEEIPGPSTWPRSAQPGADRSPRRSEPTG